MIESKDRKMIPWKHPDGTMELVDNFLIDLFDSGDWEECQVCGLLQCCCDDLNYSSVECEEGDKIDKDTLEEFEKWKKETHYDRIENHHKKIDEKRKEKHEREKKDKSNKVK